MRPARKARTPTPRLPASTRLSTLPSYTRMVRLTPSSHQASAWSAPAAAAASTAWRAKRSRSAAAAPLSDIGATDRHLRDPDRRLAGAHGHLLAVLAAEAALHREVVADRVDPRQHLQARADQRRAAHRGRDLAVLDQVTLGEAEDEV